MKNLGKRLVVLVTLVCITLGTTFAAGAKDDGKLLIGISQPTFAHPIRQAGQVLIDRWAEEHPDVDIMITDGQLNAAKQIADIEDLLSQDVDILLVAAHQSPTLVPVLERVKEAGIPIVAFDRTLTDKSVQVAEIINDDYYAGVISAEMLAEAIGGEGEIVFLLGPTGNTVAETRYTGFMDTINEKYPNIKVVDEQVANWQRVQAVDIFENMLQANPNMKGVWAQADEMALGAAKVLEDAGKKGVSIVGVDGQKDMLEAIIDGRVYGTARKVVEFPTALDVAYEYLTTGSAEERVVLEAIAVTSENVHDVYDPDAVF